MEEHKRRRTVGKVLAGLATLAGALAIFPATREAVSLAYEFITDIKHYDLPSSYPNERWSRAIEKDYAWLEDEWCYNALMGFRAKYELIEGGLRQQNQPEYPSPYKSSWEEAAVYSSNTGLIQIVYKDAEWNNYFIKVSDREKGSYFGNSRYEEDDGSVISGEKMQALSCTRCTISDGAYACKAP